MNHPSVERPFFIALLLAVTLAFFWLIQGFLQPIFWAIALAIVASPMHARLAAKLQSRPSLAATLSILIVVVVVILPLAIIGVAVANEGTALFQRLEGGGIGFESLYARLQARAPQLAGLFQRFGLDPSRLEGQAQSVAVAASRYIATRAIAIGEGTLRGTTYFFLMLYLLFFFLRDGQRILEALVRALPLGDRRERHLMRRFTDVARATIKGTVVVGIAQGTIGGIAFATLGIAAPVLWGVVMAFLSIVPAVGTALVWLPAAIYLLVDGRVFAGAAMVFIGVFVIGLVDNLLRPLLVGRDTRIPDYVILLATLGGLALFGLAGIIIGPIIAAFFLSVWHMAEEEFRDDDSGSGVPPDAT